MKKILTFFVSVALSSTLIAAEKTSTASSAMNQGFVEGNTIVDDGYLGYCLRQQKAIESAVEKIAAKDVLITTEAEEAARLSQEAKRFSATRHTSEAHEAQYKFFFTERERQRNLVLGLLEDRHRIFERSERLRAQFKEYCHGMSFNPEDLKRLCKESEFSGAYSCDLTF